MGSFWGAIVAAVIGALTKLAFWLFGGKQKAEGEQLGQTEAKLSGTREVLQDVEQAQQVRTHVDAANTPDTLRQDDGFRRS